jgi:hypothetical protein
MQRDKHTQEIEATRIGGFGGSDAKLFYKIGLKGIESLSNTDKKRIRVAKGIDERHSISDTPAMAKGRAFEDWYAERVPHLRREDKIQKIYTKKFKTFAHCDFMDYIANEVEELKCLESPSLAEHHYMHQLQWYYLLGASGVKLTVCDSTFETFEEGLQETIMIARDEQYIATLLKGIKLLSEAWDTLDLELTETMEHEELMFWEQRQIMVMASYLQEIKELEEKANLEREKIHAFMKEQNIGSIKSDFYTIQYFPESVGHTFDKKKLLKDHPEINESDYMKESKKSSYIKIILK